MAYASVKLSDLTTALSARLHDTAAVFWTNTPPFSECVSYVTEGLRVWGMLTRFTRGTAILTTTLLQSFYDLQNSTILAPTVQVQSLVTDVQMRIMEIVNATGWSGTEQFALADVTNALQRRRDQFLLETGIILTVQEISGISALSERVTIPSSIISLRRVSFIDAYTAQYTNLFRDTSRATTGFTPLLPQVAPGTPVVWAQDITVPTTIRLSPPPIDSGDLRLVSVQTGPAMDPIANPLVGVPDDFAWVVVYGAIADLCGMAGFSMDDTRRAYADARYQQGVQWAKEFGRVLRATVNGQPVQTVTLAEADGYLPGWENLVGPPTLVILAGQNLVGVPVAPDVANQVSYGLGFECILPFPIPSDPTQYLQLPAEAVDTVLDYAQHVAAVKQGGGALSSAQGLYDRFLRACGVESGKAVAEDRDLDEQTRTPSQDEAQVPRVRASA